MPATNPNTETDEHPTATPDPTTPNPTSADGPTIRFWWANNPSGLPPWQSHGRLPHSVIAAWRKASQDEAANAPAVYRG